MIEMPRSADARERDALPRFIVRPPREQFESDFAYDRGWQAITDWSVATYLDRGWECRRIACGAQIVRSPTLDEDDRRSAARRERIGRWAEAFIAGDATGDPPLWLDDREAVLREVADRLRIATADGFLMRALQLPPQSEMGERPPR